MQNNFAPPLNEFRSYCQFAEVTQIKVYNSQSIETSLNVTFRTCFRLEPSCTCFESCRAPRKPSRW